MKSLALATLLALTPVAVYADPGQSRKVIRRVIQQPQQENTHGAWGRKF